MPLFANCCFFYDQFEENFATSRVSLLGQYISIQGAKMAFRAFRVWKCSTNQGPRPTVVSVARVVSRIDPYFSVQMHAKTKLAHRLQASKMRRNSTSLKICKHDLNILTVCIMRRHCTATLKLRRSRVKHFSLHMHAKPSFAHRLQTAKMTSFRTSAQNHGPRAQNNGPWA